MNHDDLGVRKKLERVLSSVIASGNGDHLSISELCRLAGVSRSNVYVSHREVIEKLRSVRENRNHKKLGRKSSRREGDEVQKLKERVAALQLICVELYSELRIARSSCGKRSKPILKRTSHER